MAYNSRNFLKKVVEVQDLTLEYVRRGATQVWIYDHVIAPRYHISLSSYYKYLTRNVKKELKDLEAEACETCC
jgi:hypothetical protein